MWRDGFSVSRNDDAAKVVTRFWFVLALAAVEQSLAGPVESPPPGPVDIPPVSLTGCSGYASPVIFEP